VVSVVAPELSTVLVLTRLVAATAIAFAMLSFIGAPAEFTVKACAPDSPAFLASSLTVTETLVA
jgi:hypothetical protein